MRCQETRPYLLSTWVKAPILHSRKLVIASACLPHVNREVFERVSRDAVALLACPEREPAAHYGKLASIIRSSRPGEIVVVTVDGSPHCLALHAAANEAEYILGERVNKRHLVLVNGAELVEIEPDAVRAARYLSVVNELLKRNRDYVEQELARRSLEFRFSRGAGGRSGQP
jgi:hypothetical protein